MKINKILVFTSIFFLFLIKQVEAHCPLCTIGAAAAAGGAAYFGVNNAVIGVFIGAFAVSMGWWVAGLIKKKFIPFQKLIIILFSFITTIIPLMPLIKNVYPIHISLMGGYGSLLNRTYLLNLFLVGSIIGGAVLFITPWMSKKIATLRNGKMIPYQGMILTLVLLIIIGIIIQLIM